MVPNARAVSGSLYPSGWSGRAALQRLLRNSDCDLCGGTTYGRDGAIQPRSGDVVLDPGVSPGQSGKCAGAAERRSSFRNSLFSAASMRPFLDVSRASARRHSYGLQRVRICSSHDGGGVVPGANNLIITKVIINGRLRAVKKVITKVISRGGRGLACPKCGARRFLVIPKSERNSRYWRRAKTTASESW